jgi:hypothetical protein
LEVTTLLTTVIETLMLPRVARELRTNLVPLFHEGFGSFVIRAGQCDIETGGE